MVYGIGIDILDIKRLDSLRDAPNDPFFRKTYTEREREAGLRRANPIHYFAERFAAKEAVFKALHIPPDAIRLNEIETLNDESGRPYVNLYGCAKEIVERAGITHILVSLSGDGDYTAALAVCEIRSKG